MGSASAALGGGFRFGPLARAVGNGAAIYEADLGLELFGLNHWPTRPATRARPRGGRSHLGR